MIRVEALTLYLPGFSLEKVNLQVRTGEAFAVLGPTGAGKTLLLESIVGVRAIDGGRILIDGRNVTRWPPERRRIGIVYQDQALFPHLTVRQNIAYGLRYCRNGAKFPDALIERLALTPLLSRRVHTLSGGESQRVALARALAVAPSVLLLDEPLSALDPNFRDEIRSLLKTLHTETGITLLMVTHDFAEAHFLAQRAAVMHRGRIEQTGTLKAVFDRPATPFVAQFVGMKNLFKVRCEKGRIRLKRLSLTCPQAGSGICHAAVRPEKVRVDAAPGHDRINCLAGRLLRVLNRGFYADLMVEVAGQQLHAIDGRRQFLDSSWAEGTPVSVTIHPDDIHLMQ
jgi:molybdate/tungstate transport system ATP-binding protein